MPDLEEIEEGGLGSRPCLRQPCNPTVIWITGLSGAGKTTIASGLEAQLKLCGIRAFTLDGDCLRSGLCTDLGFSPEDSLESNRRAGETAILFAKAGILTICAFISPKRESRTRVRKRAEEEGIRFLEVYVNTPLHICRKRDPKHLYEMAEREILSGFLNEDANDLYEEPTSHELTVDTVNALPQNSVQTITDYLEKKKYLYCKKVKNLTQDTCHV